jgi:hypothetical protein
MSESSHITESTLKHDGSTEAEPNAGSITVVQETTVVQATEEDEKETSPKGDWDKIISSISDLSVGAIGLIYVGGFFIVNSYLSQYGAYTLSLIQSQYLAAGVLVTLMAGVMIVPEVAVASGRYETRLWRTTVLATSATSILVLLLFMLDDRSAVNMMIALIPFLFLFVGNTSISIGLRGWVWVKGGQRRTVFPGTRSGPGVGIVAVIFLITAFGFLYLFSTLTYPLIRSEFGGGTPRLVQFYGTTDELTEIQSFGVPVTDTVHANTILAQNITSPTFTIPLLLIGETSDSYLVTDTTQEPHLEMLLPRARYGVSFQVPKENISGVLYVGKKNAFNPFLVLGYALALFFCVALAGRLALLVLWPIVSRLNR